MRVIVQRVSQASVSVEEATVGAIGPGLLLLIGVEHADDMEDVHWLVQKISDMRIFADSDFKMNKSIREVGGSALVISQFTLHASTKKGNRPSFIRAARPERARQLYDHFCVEMSTAIGRDVATGRFGAMMAVSLINDGPVTIYLDSKNRE
jgi:D-tyrosyl-tRNA(Tyr) deacylase